MYLVCTFGIIYDLDFADFFSLTMKLNIVIFDGSSTANIVWKTWSRREMTKWPEPFVHSKKYEGSRTFWFIRQPYIDQI